MIDTFGRKVTYLRVSVTDRCDLRCTYCMADSMEFLPRDEVLSLEELAQLCRAFVRTGIRKIRLTGGEPLVRRNVMSLVADLGQLVRDGALDELTLTTNATQLARYADGLAEAGVRRINVSLDTLDPARFAALTRRGRLDRVMDGIMAAKAAGLAVKINAVALRGSTEEEADRLIAWCGAQGFDLCFIEAMPLGEFTANRSAHHLPLPELRGRLERHWTLRDTDYRTGGPARYVEVAETGRRIGFITPLAHSFCESCNRVRLTCTGTLFLCLGQGEAADLRQPLRSGDDAALERAIGAAIARKPQGHDFALRRDLGLSRHMSVTGG